MNLLMNYYCTMNLDNNEHQTRQPWQGYNKKCYMNVATSNPNKSRANIPACLYRNVHATENLSNVVPNCTRIELA